MAGPSDWKQRYTTFYGGVGVNFHEDGRVIHRLRQSTINDLDLCPERGRRTMTGTMPVDESDAAAVGTAVHAGIEEALLDIKQGMAPNFETSRLVAEAVFEEIELDPHFKRVKFKRKGTAQAFIYNALTVWYGQVLPTMDPIEIELEFGPLTLYEDDQRIIEVTGTIDLVDRNWGAVDWKTSGDDRRYKEGMGGQGWEKKRWAIQPTVYLWALHQMGFLDHMQTDFPFTYVVFARGAANAAELQQLTVTRHAGDFAWLAEKSLGIAKLIEAKLDVWPKNDTHALCSPIWCPAWDTCKGANYGDGWPKRSVAVDIGAKPTATVGP